MGASALAVRMIAATSAQPALRQSLTDVQKAAQRYDMMKGHLTAMSQRSGRPDQRALGIAEEGENFWRAKFEAELFVATGMHADEIARLLA